MYFIFLNEKYNDYVFNAKKHVVCYNASLLKSIKLYERQYSKLESKYDISRWHSVECGEKYYLLTYPIGLDNHPRDNVEHQRCVLTYKLTYEWKEFWEDV